jgi:serine/threonine-protein kinase
MSSASTIPTELFGYKVVDKVGEGAASVVYAVMDPKSRQVMALKHVLRRTDKDQRFIDQIEQEYKVGSKLDHVNIRAIKRYLKNHKYMFGTVTDAALLMELVDAATLDTGARPSAANIANYFAQTARALAHMHERGFVHADMKPSNMMVCEDGTVKVIDLGQACAVGTVKKRIQGTPGYIAPEQAFRQEITPLTDVYNFGATLYWVLLRDEIPCALPSGNTRVSSAIEPSQIRLPKPPHQQDGRIPSELSDVVMQCIPPHANQRMQSMAMIADRLDVIAAHCRRTGAGRELEGMVSAGSAPDRNYDSEPSRKG